MLFCRDVFAIAAATFIPMSDASPIAAAICLLMLALPMPRHFSACRSRPS